MAYDYAASIGVTSSGASLDVATMGFAPVSVLIICSSSGVEPLYFRLGASSATSSNGFALLPGEKHQESLVCLDSQSRQAWSNIAFVCESSSSGQTATARFWASAV